MNSTPSCITLDADLVAIIKGLLRPEDRLPGESVTGQVKRFALVALGVGLGLIAAE
jgi:hypothetical protein